jgi:hypothetical protein
VPLANPRHQDGPIDPAEKAQNVGIQSMHLCPNFDSFEDYFEFIMVGNCIPEILRDSHSIERSTGGFIESTEHGIVYLKFGWVLLLLLMVVLFGDGGPVMDVAFMDQFHKEEINRYPI